MEVGRALASPEFGRHLISPPGFLELNLVILGMKDAWLARVDKPIRINLPPTPVIQILTGPLTTHFPKKKKDG